MSRRAPPCLRFALHQSTGAERDLEVVKQPATVVPPAARPAAHQAGPCSGCRFRQWRARRRQLCQVRQSARGASGENFMRHGRPPGLPSLLLGLRAVLAGTIKSPLPPPSAGAGRRLLLLLVGSCWRCLAASAANFFRSSSRISTLATSFRLARVSLHLLAAAAHCGWRPSLGHKAGPAPILRSSSLMMCQPKSVFTGFETSPFFSAKAAFEKAGTISGAVK